MDSETVIEIKPFVNFTEVCRICLIKSNEMRQLTDPENPEIDQLINQLISVANWKLEIVPNLPNFLCWSCEEKLKLSYDFQQLCLKSQEIIKSYLENNSEQKVIFNELVTDEIIKVENHKNGSFNKHKQKLKSKKLNKGKINNKGTKRLQIIPDEEIREAIKVYKERYGQPKICLICKFFTKNANALAVHMTRKHPSVKETWCYLCNEEFENLSAHKTTHIKTDNKCPFCNKIFPIPQHYLEHLKSHSDSRCFPCKICNLEYRYRRDLFKHVQTKHKKAHLEIQNEKLCEIVQENKTEANFSLDDRNQQSINNISKSDKNELCPHCGKQFTTLYKLNVHMRTHTGLAPYKCRYCEKTTTTVHYLKAHERTHTGEKPYVCNYCGKAFAQHNTLRTHRKRHTGETINCTICDKTFCRKSELRIHMRSHTGEKPYPCEMCDKAFKQRSHLMEHLNTHKESGDFQCQYCEKNFKMKSTLNAHLLIHTGLKPYKCSYCSYECRRNSRLKKHLEQHRLEHEIHSEPEIVVNNN